MNFACGFIQVIIVIALWNLGAGAWALVVLPYGLFEYFVGWQQGRNTTRYDK